ncbi:conserved hypothetical protein [Paenibacillus curdlanolyticus YK9]|uniref:Tetratricopeptide repeat protein n=1 Tax=Paenibacillus curdlanolyticus YK9 TaxID=717606 RepID=E0I9W4_9BACL|nr:hypothetical protein [Paenibacillus curdlanolyticus]EFM10541.1 conserved hypothetical protein [Paenibacillus curdlanolyticus YK9]
MLDNALLVYYIVAVVYSAYRLIRRNGEFAIGICLTLLLPFGGILLSWLTETLRRRFEPDTNLERFKALTELEEDIRERIYQQVDVQKETNIVPMEEALVVNDHMTRRRLLLDMLKGDIDEYGSLLEQAVNNEDTETSHYAVSAVLEMKRKLQVKLQQAAVEYDRQPDNLESAAKYAGALGRLIAGGFMDIRTKRGYLSSYTTVLDKIMSAGIYDETMFANKIDCEMELGQYERAIEDCDKFREVYPNSEQAYLSSLRVYYELKRRERFFGLLEELKALPIRLSHDTQSVLQYWTGSGVAG